MKRLLIAVLTLLATAPSVLRADSEWIAVKKVYDGDTIKLKDGRKVRMIGIDTPELHPNEKLANDVKRTHRDAKTLLKMGKKSYEVLKKAIGKGPVRLEYDQDSHDKYHRSLAYVFVRMKPERFAKIMKAPKPKDKDEGEREYMLNREMIRYGWADAFRNFDYRYKTEFIDLEKRARQEGIGLWKK